MTGHRDHKAVSAWATEAFHLAAPPGARLYYATVTPEWNKEIAPRLAPFNCFMEPGTPPVTPREDLAICFDLSPQLLELKLKAIAAHTSQVEGMLSALGEDFFRVGHRSEFFKLAAAK